MRGDESNGPYFPFALSVNPLTGATDSRQANHFTLSLHSTPSQKTLSSSFAHCHHTAHMQRALQRYAVYANCRIAAFPSRGLLRVCLCCFKEDNSRGCQISEGRSFMPQAFSSGVALLPLILSNIQQRTCRRCDKQCFPVIPSPPSVIKSSDDCGCWSFARLQQGLFMVRLAPLRVSVFK